MSETTLRIRYILYIISSEEITTFFPNVDEGFPAEEERIYLEDNNIKPKEVIKELN
jgi:hypothetical protein